MTSGLGCRTINVSAWPPASRSSPVLRDPEAPDRIAKYNYNQIVSAHKEVYASFKSDELQADVDRVFKEKPASVPELPATS